PPHTARNLREKGRRGVPSRFKIPPSGSPVRQCRRPSSLYISDDFGDVKAYSLLDSMLDRFDRERGTGGNRLFYLATPPSFFPVIVQHLGRAGLAKTRDPEKNWTRIIIEKPFGRDHASAQELNRTVTSVF